MNEPRTLTRAIDQIIEQIRALDWPDQIYPRVHQQAITLAGQERPQVKPMALLANGQYADARPSDKYKSVLFFASTGPEKSDYTQAKPAGHAQNHIIRASRPLTLYGWVNLAKLADYDDGSGYAELLKLSLKKAIQHARSVTAIGEWRDGPIGEVFKPFVVSDLDTQFDRWPYACFRLELVVQCVETNVS